MKDNSSGQGLHDQLQRWVSEGLIEPAQAAGIEAAEAARSAEAPPASPTASAHGRQDASEPAPSPRTRTATTPGRRALVVEALGYLGGALTIVAGFVAVARLWPGIPVGAETAFAATAAVLLGVAGALVHGDSAPALGRLRSVLLLLSAASLAACAGVLAVRAWHLSASSATLLTAVVATGYASALWLATRAPAQHLAVFVGVAVSVGAGVVVVVPGAHRSEAGLAVWLLSLIWGAAVERGWIRPASVGCPAAAVGLIVSAQMMTGPTAGQVLALVTVVILLAAGVLLRRIWLLVLGAFSAVVFVPQAATRYLPSSVAAPLAVLTVGVVLLGAALRLAKHSRRPGPR